MNLNQVNNFIKMINESNKDITKLTTGGANGKNGKGADSIAVGAATPYKEKQTTKSIFDSKFPAVGNIVKKLKKDSLRGNQLVTGAALAQVKNMLQILPLNKDENGDYILPFGNKIRLKERNGIYYIGFKEKDKINPTK